MRIRPDAPQWLLSLGGAAVLTVLSISSLPRFTDILRAPSTPFDRSATPNAASDYTLFWTAASVIPAGSTVAPISEPRNASRETFLHREAVGLLPGRRVLAAAEWGNPTHLEEQADYLIVAGPKPTLPPGRLLLDTPAGSVWRRTGR
jgi:hypothetical protein